MRPHPSLVLLFSLVLLALSSIAHAQSPPRTIRAARLLDGRGQVVDDVLITVENGRITRVEHPPAIARPTIELRNLTLLPGLIDTHAHVGWYFNRQGRYHGGRDGETLEDGIVAGEANVHAMLLGGVTTIQSPGAVEDREIRDRVATGAIPGPRILTSLQPLMNPRTTPEEFRATVRARKQQGADFIKVFASGSIRDGGMLTLTEEQLRAICDEAKAVGLRVMIHAHSPDSVKAAALAGCTQIEHGVFVTEENLKLLTEGGIYFDPQIDLVMRNYLENRAKYQGIGNFNDAGFKTMQEVLPQFVRTYQKALATPGLKIIFGSDAVAGSHGRNVEELISRVKDGDRDGRRSVARRHGTAPGGVRDEGRQGVPRSRRRADNRVRSGRQMARRQRAGGPRPAGLRRGWHRAEDRSAWRAGVVPALHTRSRLHDPDRRGREIEAAPCPGQRLALEAG
jgi:imidazolonepropionase-like amidohydrolase